MLKTLERPAASAPIAANNRHGIKAELVVITPSIAEAWLAQNENNRPIYQAHVQKIANDMKSGNYVVTGEAIKFDTKRRLIDGQHRLHAIIASGKSVEMLVIYGLQPKAQDVIDTGKARTPGNMLAIHGAANSNQVATALRILVNEKRGLVWETPVSHADIMAAYKAHPAIVEWIPYPRSMPKGITLGLVGFVAYVGANMINKKTRAGAMLKVLRTGESDYPNDPIHRFRERIISRQPWVRMDGGNPRHLPFNTFRWAWNHFAVQEEITALRVQRDPVPIRGLKLSDL